MRLPDGTIINVDPPDRDATVRIQFKEGKLESITYSQSPEAASQPLAQLPEGCKLVSIASAG